ncbi:hypothetical protein GJAV_G00270260 [Gymnothorax javanicus]|nr:hypothetical protein GJAV_G00270260 [Gymnothorax javanicus]
MSVFESEDIPLELIKNKIDRLRAFLKISLSIANAHTVDFYTCDVWEEFIAVSPDSVLSILNSENDQRTAPENHRSLSNERQEAGNYKTSFGFCDDSKRLVDVAALLDAAKRFTLPGLGVCVPRSAVLQKLRDHHNVLPTAEDAVLEPEEFMNSKKSHEVQIMSELVGNLAQHCGVRQVVDVGSGKGYLCSYLSLRYGLQVYGIDSSSTNTHGAQERNRKLQKYSRVYQRHRKAGTAVTGAAEGEKEQSVQGVREQLWEERDQPVQRAREQQQKEGELSTQGGEREEVLAQGELKSCTGVRPSQHQDTEKQEVPVAMVLSEDVGGVSSDLECPSPFLGALSPELVEQPRPRVPPAQLSAEERERRKRENMDRKRRGHEDSLYSPLTSYITPHTELRDLITHLEEALLVGLHTCGDLAPSTLRMFTAKPELRAVCSVGCCYHLLSEEFDPSRTESSSIQWGFPMSAHLRDQAWHCGRNARMSACLALERVSAGGGLPSESLFYRAVLHVILRDHYGSFKSEKRVGNVFSKSSSFVDYVRRALRKLDLDDTKLTDALIQGYHETYKPRRQEMVAFNMLKVTLAPCIEALFLLDRLCYLKEQEITSFSAVVQLFDPLTSPRCYGIVAIKKQSA